MNWSRREFLKRLGIGGAAAGLVAATVPMMEQAAEQLDEWKPEETEATPKLEKGVMGTGRIIMATGMFW